MRPILMGQKDIIGGGGGSKRLNWIQGNRENTAECTYTGSYGEYPPPWGVFRQKDFSMLIQNGARKLSKANILTSH